MKKASTLFLRATVVVMALAVLAFCVFAIPAAWPDAGMYRPILIVMCVSVIPFFWALYETMKLLGLIDANTAFSEASVKILKNIRHAGIAIALLYIVGMPFLFVAADQDDAPGAIVIGLVVIGASMVISVFSAVLEKLLQNAIDIKKENELVV